LCRKRNGLRDTLSVTERAECRQHPRQQLSNSRRVQERLDGHERVPVRLVWDQRFRATRRACFPIDLHVAWESFALTVLCSC